MAKKSEWVEVNTLKSLIPLCDLAFPSLRELASKTRLIEIPAGRVLFDDSRALTESIYLLGGTVEIVSEDGESDRITGGTSAAKTSLIQKGSSMKYRARAKTDVCVIRISNNLLEVLLGDGVANAFELEEIEEDDQQVENQLFHRLYHEYMSGSLELNSLPELAVRVRRAVQNPDKSAVDISKIVQSDPAIAARLIQIANSPMYRGKSEITDCFSAITRLGLNNTKDIVTSLTMQQLFCSSTKLISKRMNLLWQHSTHVAAISSVLAKMTPALKVDRALLAGLIHDIGVLAILSYADLYPELANDQQQLDRTIRRLRSQIGALVLRKWSFASDLVTVALESEQWLRNSDPGPDYCDIVLVAQIHSFAGTPQMATCPPLMQLPAFLKLPLCRTGPEKSMEILHQAKSDIAEMKRLLTG